MSWNYHLYTCYDIPEELKELTNTSHSIGICTFQCCGYPCINPCYNIMVSSIHYIFTVVTAHQRSWKNSSTRLTAWESPFSLMSSTVMPQRTRRTASTSLTGPTAATSTTVAEDSMIFGTVDSSTIQSKWGCICLLLPRLPKFQRHKLLCTEYKSIIYIQSPRLVIACWPKVR